MKCASCLDGFYSLSSQGCIPCYCSNRTNQCSLASNSSSGSSPQEICDCPFPFTGLSCESCIEGYYVSAISGLCELCNCSGRASRCADGDGQCIVSRDFWCFRFCYDNSFCRTALIIRLVQIVKSVLKACMMQILLPIFLAKLARVLKLQLLSEFMELIVTGTK